MFYLFIYWLSSPLKYNEDMDFIDCFISSIIENIWPIVVTQLVMLEYFKVRELWVLAPCSCTHQM